ncbi:MAG: trigger factor [Mariniphaga sp.]
MKISKTSIDDLNLVVRIAIEKQDYAATVNETLKDYRKKANLPGFRKGMVPTGLIKKMYGKAALADEVNKLLSHELTKYITDQNLNILGEPLPSATEKPTMNFDSEDDFEFVFDIGLIPEINVDFDKIGKLPFYEIAVDDQLIDNQINDYANRFGEKVSAEVVGEKETVIGDLVQLNAEGIVIEGGITALNVQFGVQLIKDEVIKNIFLGAKESDILKFNPRVALANDHEVAHLLKIKEEEIESADSDFNFTINTINSFVPAEIDESLIKKIYGEDTEVTTVAELRQRIQTEMKSNLLYSSNYRFLVDAKEAITTFVSMKLPEDFLKRWLVETNEKVTIEQIEEEFGSFRKDLEWTLIKSKLVKENDLRVDESDIAAMAREMALMQFQQYGMSNVPDEYLDNYANSILQNKEQKQKMAEKKVEDKVLELIKERASLDFKQVSQKTFDDLFEK